MVILYKIIFQTSTPFRETRLTSFAGLNFYPGQLATTQGKETTAAEKAGLRCHSSSVCTWIL
nr:MAG TPA: hypothetical protein [Caudoviricetes sp.]